MKQLLQEFETPIPDRAGSIHKVYLFGRSRPGDTWQGWLVFERQSDGQRFETPIETTQSNREAVVHWAGGLTETHLADALERAQRPATGPVSVVAPPPPLVDRSADSGTRRQRLAEIERAVLACFTRQRTTRLLTRDLLDALDYANADVVRALEDLEKQSGLLVRRTEEGNDLLFLTERGVEETRLVDVGRTVEVVDREPPKIR